MIRTPLQKACLDLPCVRLRPNQNLIEISLHMVQTYEVQFFLDFPVEAHELFCFDAREQLNAAIEEKLKLMQKIREKFK